MIVSFEITEENDKTLTRLMLKLYDKGKIKRATKKEALNYIIKEFAKKGV